MSILDKPGEWKKHWFVLTDSSLRYYRDSNAEEADDLDGEIDLRSCTDVTEFAVQRNYGFQIHTKDAIFTLSAMTSGIRRNWIEALRKNVRPVSAPDVTKLSDCNKENTIRNCVPPKSSLRVDEQQQPSSEGSTKGSTWRADGPHHAFDYVELSPLQQDTQNQGSPPRTRGSLRVSERVSKHEDLERDLAVRSEERRKWFESPDSRVSNSDGLGGTLSRKVEEPDLPAAPLSEEQRVRLNEEIEKKWLELERLPLKDSRRVPLTTLLNQGKGNHGDANEALKKEVQSLRAQLESCRARNESLREAAKSQGDGHVPRGYISQEACERSLAEMESSHQQVMEELQRHHQREMERLRQEKERLLAEEAAATAAAIEALKKAHREEMNKELGRTRSFQQCGSVTDALQKQLCVCEVLALRARPNPHTMQNDAGEFVDLYVPRKCSASNRIIGAKDHASIQINISEVDKVTGRVNGQFKTYAICGAIRRMVGIFLKQNMIVFLFVLMGRFLGMLGPGK